MGWSANEEEEEEEARYSNNWTDFYLQLYHFINLREYQ
jgi:hypothetical protein